MSRVVWIVFAISLSLVIIGPLRRFGHGNCGDWGKWMLVRKEATKTSVLVFAVPDPRTGHSGLMEPRYVARQEEMRGVRSNASVNEGVVTRNVRE